MGNFFAQLDYLSCTTDIWSSMAQDSMLSLTAHCIHSDFNRISMVLQSATFNTYLPHWREYCYFNNDMPKHLEC